MTSQASRQPRPVVLFGLALACSLLLFARSPGTGFVYDEQEAILANPYLRGEVPWWQALHVDFWGLSAERTIGSYRPLPNFVWRPLAASLRFNTPFFLQLLGPLLHAVVALLLYLLLRRHSRAGTGSNTAPTTPHEPALVGAAFFLTLGITSEAVVAVVGQADLWVACFTLLGLLALDLPPLMRGGAIFLCVLLGLLAKETMVGSVPLLCIAPLILGTVPGRLARSLRALGVLLASVVGIFALVLVRRHFFLGAAQPGLPELTLPGSGIGWLLRFFEQPRLPIDPQNNPLLRAPLELRLPTAAGIYASNVLQMLLPLNLQADYSFPREVPHGWTVRAWLGLGCAVVPLGFGLLELARTACRASADTAGRWSESRRLLVLATLWLPIAYLPVSNMLVLLPTIRAERLLYVPALGLAIALAALWPRVGHRRIARQALLLLALTSALQGRAHALHYESDVTFWRATARGTPSSAKAYLNLGVMLGARGDREGRINATEQSVRLAPKWPMAHVYLGDALCRAGRAEEAIPHYVRGFELSPDQKDISALALQCLWEAGAIDAARPELERAASRDPDGWLAYLLREVTMHGHDNAGVPPAYRPRGYNQR